MLFCSPRFTARQTRVADAQKVQDGDGDERSDESSAKEIRIRRPHPRKCPPPAREDAPESFPVGRAGFRDRNGSQDTWM